MSWKLRVSYKIFSELLVSWLLLKVFKLKAFQPYLIFRINKTTKPILSEIPETFRKIETK
jgi:hypothetical protein